MFHRRCSFNVLEFQIEVPEKMNELRYNSVLGLGVKAENWKMILVILKESQM